MISMMLRNLVLTTTADSGAKAAFRVRLATLAASQKADLSDDDVGALTELGERYIRETLRLLESFATSAGQARAEPIASPIVQAAERLTLQPDPSIPDQGGLLGLICSCYLSRELVAKVSEQTRMMRGFPLVASDPHSERAIIKSILGADLAATLDALLEDKMMDPSLRFIANGAYGLNGSLRATGRVSDWAASWEEDVRRCGAAVGISFG